jgi:hypothetical protein
MIEAPWTEEQVKSLNEYQRAAWMHPFTCANRGQGFHPWRRGDRGVLTATVNGWICDDCDYTQNWAHDFMFEDGWKQAFPF